MTPTLREPIEAIVQALEISAVAIMVVLIVAGTLRAALDTRRHATSAIYTTYRVAVGRAMLIGLELLVAADIINTVMVELTLANLATLGALVVVRTLLGWTIAVEVEGRWPWQQRRGHEPVPPRE